MGKFVEGHGARTCIRVSEPRTLIRDNTASSSFLADNDAIFSEKLWMAPWHEETYSYTLLFGFWHFGREEVTCAGPSKH